MSDEMIIAAVNRNPSVPLNATIDNIDINARNLSTRLTITRANNLDVIPSINTNVNTILSRTPAGGSGLRSVQRGRATVGATALNITISTVNRLKSFVILSSITHSLGNESGAIFNAHFHLNSNTNLRVDVIGSRGAGVVEWQVIEFN